MHLRGKAGESVVLAYVLRAAGSDALTCKTVDVAIGADGTAEATLQ